MSVFVASVLLGIVLAPNPVSGEEMGWTRQFGTPGLDAARVIAVDDEEVYVAGLVAGALPGQVFAGGSDVFLRRYESRGREIWTRQFGTPGLDAATVVGSLDAQDSAVYVGGQVAGALPGQSAAGDWDAFIRRYNSAGEEVWTRQFGTAGQDVLQGISVHGRAVYVGGFVSDALPGQAHAGGLDAFVRKYDSDGTERWTQQFGSPGRDGTWSVVAAKDGVYVVGEIEGALPGQTHAGGADSFIRKYDKAGNEVWTDQFGTSGPDALHGVAVRGESVYAAGEVLGALPGQTAAGGFDAFLRKYETDGSVVWTRQFGTSGRDNIWGVEAHRRGVFVVGFVADALPGQTFAGGLDAFVRRYDAAGNVRMTVQFGTPGIDVANDIGFEDLNDGVYVGGVVEGPLPGQTHSGGRDAFVLKLLSDEDHEEQEVE